MFKAEKAFDSYKFLSWLNDFIQSRQGRSNLPQIQLPRSKDSLNEFLDNESYERGEQTPESEMETSTLENPNKWNATKGLWTTENIN